MSGVVDGAPDTRIVMSDTAEIVLTGGITQQHSEVEQGIPVRTNNAAPSDGNKTSSTTGSKTDTEHNSSATDSSKSDVRVSRHDWDKIRAIPDSNFQELLHAVITKYDVTNRLHVPKLTLAQCRVNQRMDGGFHHVVFMAMVRGDIWESWTERFIFRIPAISTSARWQPGDEHNLRCEVSLMKWLHQNTTVPVPEIIDAAVSLESPIGAPYVLVSRLP
jgi:hypothetical protein